MIIQWPMQTSSTALSRSYDSLVLGFGWGDDVIDENSVNDELSMIGALGKMTEWELHCNGAIRNGCSLEEIRAIVHVIGIYCGVPQALECMRVARKVLDEHNMLDD